MEKSKELLHALEDILVKEFRASQALYKLAREERLALSQDDVLRLLTLMEYKETLLDVVEQLDDDRHQATLQIGNLPGQGYRSIIRPLPCSVEIGLVLAPESLGRLDCLWQGIQVLRQRINEITHGNLSLARLVLERADTVQVFLAEIHPSQIDENYQELSVASGVGSA